MDYSSESFNKFVLDNNVVGFFEEPIELKSGRISNWYVNWRNVAGDVFLLNQLAEYVTAFTKDLGLHPDCFYGVPEGATKVANRAQFLLAESSPNYGPGSHVLPMGRGKPKEHGAPKDKYFVGQPKGRTIILEDVTTTGGSLLSTIDNLMEAEIPVIAAFGLTNRMELRDDGQSVRKAVVSKNVLYFSLSNALELLPEAYGRLNPGRKIADAIEAEFQQYGVEKLKLR